MNRDLGCILSAIIVGIVVIGSMVMGTIVEQKLGKGMGWVATGGIVLLVMGGGWVLLKLGIGSDDHDEPHGQPPAGL